MCITSLAIMPACYILINITAVTTNNMIDPFDYVHSMTVEMNTGEREDEPEPDEVEELFGGTLEALDNLVESAKKLNK